jgi:hypothetical protein
MKLICVFAVSRCRNYCGDQDKNNSFFTLPSGIGFVGMKKISDTSTSYFNPESATQRRHWKMRILVKKHGVSPQTAFFEKNIDFHAVF